MSHLSPERLEELAQGGGADPHLEGCAECRASLVRARGRVKLLKELKPYTLADVAFQRVEAKLMEEVERPRGFNWLRLGLGVALAASIAGVAWYLAPKPAVEPMPVAVRPRPAPLKVLDHELTAMRVEGVAKRLPSGRALTAGETVASGERLDAAGKVVLSGERLVLEGKGQLGLGGGLTADADDTLAAQVEPGEETALVHCAGTYVGGVDAAFVVTRAGAEMVLEVTRGEVKVAGEAQLRDAVTVKAPAAARLSHGRLVGGVAQPAEPAKLAVLPARPWAKLDLDFPAGTQLELDGGKVGVAPISLMWTEGKHRWRTVGPGQVVHEGWLELIGGKPFTLRPPPEPAEVEPSEDAVAALNRALREQTPKLRACYEKWLKATPAASGEVELNLRLGATGQVLKVQVDPHETGMSKEALDCLARTARSLRLPPLGSEQDVALPLILTPGR